jgi:hypothetical protein
MRDQPSNDLICVRERERPSIVKQVQKHRRERQEEISIFKRAMAYIEAKMSTLY